MPLPRGLSNGSRAFPDGLWTVNWIRSAFASHGHGRLSPDGEAALGQSAASVGPAIAAAWDVAATVRAHQS